MTDRSKTAWVLGGATLTMFSPLAMVLAGYRIPMFQNLGFAHVLINTVVEPWLMLSAVSGKWRA